MNFVSVQEKHLSSVMGRYKIFNKGASFEHSHDTHIHMTKVPEILNGVHSRNFINLHKKVKYQDFETAVLVAVVLSEKQ